MGLLENFRVALGSVRDNWLRAILTMIIIAFGIMALVGILTAIDAAIYSLSSNLSSLGANTFSVEQKNLNIQGNRRGRRSKRSAPFSYQQANEFMERYAFPAQVSISFSATGTGVVKYGKLETNPNTILMGMTRNYLTVKATKLPLGAILPTERCERAGILRLLVRIWSTICLEVKTVRPLTNTSWRVT